MGATCLQTHNMPAAAIYGRMPDSPRQFRLTTAVAELQPAKQRLGECLEGEWG
jgi:hypothetical protein